jgi:hypothetical protein
MHTGDKDRNKPKRFLPETPNKEEKKMAGTVQTGTQARLEITAEKETKFTGRSEVRITGRVVRKFAAPERGFTALTIATRAGTAETNYPSVMFFGRAAIETDKLIDDRAKPRPTVEIDGEIQTAKITGDSGVVYKQTVVGLRLASAKTGLDSRGILGPNGETVGTEPANDENSVLIIGEIIHVFPFRSGTVLTVRTYGEGRPNFPKITCFGRQGKFAEGLTPGEIVCAAGVIQTARKEIRGETRFFESVVCTDIDRYAAPAG